MTTIEESLLALITADNGNWASNPTKKEYIKVHSDTRALNLDNPIVGADEVIVIVGPAADSIRNELGGANVYLFEGVIDIFGTNKADVETAMTRLKTIGDAQTALFMIKQAIVKQQYRDYFLGTVRYEWYQLINDG